MGYVYAQIPQWLDRSKRSQSGNYDSLPKSLTMLLDAFEEERLKHKRRSDLWDMILFTVFGGLSWAYFTQLDPRMARLYFLVLLMFAAIMWIKSRFFRLKNFTVEYKQEVLGGLIAGLDYRLEYARNQRVPNQELANSGLFGIADVMDGKTPLTLEGEDYIHGEIDGINLQISDLELYKGEGEQVRLVFTGTFLVAEFPKPFAGDIYVMPDFSEVHLLQDMLHQVANKKTYKVEAPQVAIDDADFEKVYEVYGSDISATEALLTSGVRAQLMALDGKSDDTVQVACSFRGNYLYLGSLFSNLQFEPKLHRPVNRPEDWQAIYTQISLYLSLLAEVQKAQGGAE